MDLKHTGCGDVAWIRRAHCFIAIRFSLRWGFEGPFSSRVSNSQTSECWISYCTALYGTFYTYWFHTDRFLGIVRVLTMRKETAEWRDFKTEFTYKKGNQERISIRVIQRPRIAIDLWVKRVRGGRNNSFTSSITIMFSRRYLIC